MATFKLELTAAEASALEQIVSSATIRGKDARVIASIQDKFDESADAHNADLKKEKNSSPSDPPSTETPRPEGDEGGEVLS